MEYNQKFVDRCEKLKPGESIPCILNGEDAIRLVRLKESLYVILTNNNKLKGAPSFIKRDESYNLKAFNYVWTIKDESCSWESAFKLSYLLNCPEIKNITFQVSLEASYEAY